MRDAKADDTGRFILMLRRALLASALLYVVLFLAVAALRLGYPFELEWMEGACVDHVRRILAGEKLYVAPSLHFVPFVYPPLYFYLSAGAAWLLGVGFLPLRLVSLAATIGCFIIIYLMVRRQTRSSFAGALAAGLFAACFRIAGAWYDIARVDMLHVFLLLAAIHLVQLDLGWPYQVAAGVLTACSFLTKQIALPIILPVFGFALVCQRARGLVFVLVSLALAGGSAWLLDRAHQGWYGYYVFQLPRQHETDRAAVAAFWPEDMLAPLPAAFAFAVLALVHEFRRSRRSFWLWGAVTVGAVGGSWAGRAHPGGYSNVLIPAYAAVSALFAVGVEAAVRGPETAPRRFRRALVAAAYLLAIAQFAHLHYDPRGQLPTAADRRAGEELIATMRSIEGEVYLPYHGYLGALAGKQTHAHAMAVWDVARGSNERAKEGLLSEIIGAVRGQRFGAVIVDSDVYAQPDLDQHYLRQPIQFPADAFWPVTGMRTRPKYLCLPRPSGDR